MTLNDAFETLETIAATSSRNEKQALLAEALKDPAFRAVCVYAYNPFVTFGIAPSRERQGASGTKYAGMLGGVIVNRDGVEVRVGGGFSDQLRAGNPSGFIGRLIEVEYHEVTPDGSLRHPRFVRFRDDKDKGVV